MTSSLVCTMALLSIWSLAVSSVALAQPALVVKPLAEKRLAQLPSGPLFWRLETFPVLAEARAAAGPTALVAESAGRVWLFTLGPAGMSSPGGTKVAEIGPGPPIPAPEFQLRVNEASGPPGSVTPVHTHPGSEAFYVLAGEQSIQTAHGVVRIPSGRAESGHTGDTPMQVSSSGSTDLHAHVMFVVDATRPFSSPASDTIQPSSAARFEQVTITGNGFGGRNVRISVGGVAAEVLAATGNRVTFRVPWGAVPGPTTVTATNPGGHSGSIGFTVLNRAPQAHAGSDQTAFVTTTVQLDGAGSTDADGDRLTFHWSFLSQPDGSTAVLTDPSAVRPSFVVDRPGRYTIQLVVNDGFDDSSPDTVLVDTENSPPTANAGPDQTVFVGTFVQLDGSGSSDVDGDLLGFRWSFVSIPSGSAATLSDPIGPAPQFLVDLPGQYVVQLMVSDGAAESRPDIVTIDTRNSRPVADAGPDQTVTVGDIVQLDASHSSDVDGDALSFRWSFVSRPDGSAAVISDPIGASPTFLADVAGLYVVQLVVNDGTIDSQPDTAAVTVNPPNAAPGVDAGPDQTITLPSPATLDGTATDDGLPPGSALAVAWTKMSGPGSVTFANATAAQTTATFSQAGTYVLRLTADDGELSSTDDVTVTVNPPNLAPLVNAGPDLTITLPEPAALHGAATDDGLPDPPATLTVSWTVVSGPGTVAFTNAATADTTASFSESGTYVLRLTATDGALSASAEVSVTVNPAPPVNQPPVVSAGPDQTITLPASAPLTGTASDDGLPAPPGAVTTTWSVVSGPGTVAFGDTLALTTTATFSAAGSYVLRLTAFDGQLTTTADLAITVNPTGLPPDPVTVAPPLDQTVFTTLQSATAFLYTGTEPIQTGVATGAIEARRAAVLKGKVLDGTGAALGGVRISILGHPELGQTLTRADGMFDLAVNGGGVLTVNYEKAGLLPAQRQVETPWSDYAFLPDVVLIPLDPQVTAVDLSASVPMQVARGSVSTDADGTRQATLLFPQGTAATMVFPDGSTRPLTTLSVRATEYTVGPNGPLAMPADLPPNSAYTYALDFTVDESKAAGAIDVRFSPSLPFYVENFLNFPVGTIVPLGSYDRARGMWEASDSGRVIRILRVTGGLAEVDTNGDGQADNALSMTDSERQRLATLYTPGQSLWRVLIPHFDQPWDINWPFGPPGGAVGPDQDSEPDDPLSCTQETQQPADSSIGCQNQTLGEDLGVVGTPFGLHYESDRTPGRNSRYTLDIPLNRLNPPLSPPGLKAIVVDIRVAGQRHTESLPPASLQTSFTWDGKDAYGRTLQGTQPITVRVCYQYDGVYQRTSRFGYNGGGAITGSRSRREVGLCRSSEGAIGAWDARAIGLGGWMLSPHHAYDPAAQVVYRGDGGRQGDLALVPIITNFAGGASGGLVGCDAFGDGGPATRAEVCPRALATAADGSVYIADLARRVRRVAPNGIITTVAGNGTSCSGDFAACGDGGPATQARLTSPRAVVVAPDGSLYIGDSDQRRVRRVGPDGIITTVAGNGNSCPAPNLACGDGGPATLATVAPVSLALGVDGSLYIGDGNTRKVRLVGPDGIITTVAGNGGFCAAAGFSPTAPCGDGGLATSANLFNADSIAVGRDGTLYISDSALNRVRRVTTDGIIGPVAGTGAQGSGGDGGPATQATFRGVGDIGLGRDQSLYIFDAFNRSVRWMRPDGTINRLAGNGTNSTSGDGGPAAQAGLAQPDQAPDGVLAVGPDGSVYVGAVGSSGLTPRVRRISPAAAGLSADGVLVPSGDGVEVYLFAFNGRHLRTVDALTGALRYQFAYDGSGRLASVTDGDANVTTVERDAAGNPTGVLGPFGQRTTLAVNADGYLSRVTSPAGEAVQLAHAAGGLLTGVTDPRGQSSSYTYDALGRLTSATDRTGAPQTLARTGTNRNYTVTHTSPLGRATAYHVERLSTGSLQLTTTDPAGLQARVILGRDGIQTATYPDGTSVRVVLGPDPRWGMQAPIAASQVMTTPAGLVRTVTVQRTVTLGAANDPLSLRTQTDTLSINGRASITTFDAPSRTLTTTSAAGRRSTLVLDDRARPARRQFGDLEATALTYDDRGRLATVARGGRITSFTYGGDGFLARLTDAIGRTIAFTHDADGRVTEERLPGDRVVRFTYDPNGNLTTLTPPGRPDHTFSYTPRDDVATYVPPAVGAEIHQEQYSYNSDRQPLRGDRADGQAVQFQYDTAGRLSLLGLVSGDRSYGYDAAGRLTSLTAPSLSMTYTYDGALPTGSVWSGAIPGTVTRTFDNDFRVISHSVDGANPVATQYDADSLRTQVGALSLTRSVQTGFITATALGALSDRRGFDTFGDLIQYSASHGGSVAYALDLTRDALGRITSKTETLGGATHVFSYTYDVAGRLAEVRQDGLLTEAYTYDANDNRLTGPQPLVTYAYDEQDRLTQRSGLAGQNYSYTPNGERQSKSLAGQTTTYRYDSLGHLIGVSLPGGAQIDYVLDGIGRRVGKRVDGARVQGFLYQDGLRPIAELDGAGNEVSRFVYAGLANVPAYLIKGGATYRIIADQLGSPRLVIDTATGSVAQHLDYDTFGNVLLDTNPGFQPFGFAGGLYDPDTKLTRYGLRDYDAESGGWTTRDPLGFSGGPNLYSYAYNDPVNFIDPLGNAPRKVPLPPDQPAPPMNPNFTPSAAAPTPRGPAESEKVFEEIFRKASKPPPPGPGYRSPLGAGGTSLPPPPSPLTRTLTRICKAASFVGAAIEVGYWGYLAKKGEWGQLTQSVVRSTPVGDAGWGAFDVANTEDVQVAGWKLVKNLVPITGIGAWAGERLTSDDYTLKFWEAEWWPPF